LDDGKALDPIILDLQKITLICDYFVICHGTSPTHIRGMVDHLLTELRKQGIRSAGLEGYQDAEWVLLDFGDVIVHVFSEESRKFYSLEKLWGDAPRLEKPVAKRKPAGKTRTAPKES
jgi:ribosome-associated protein